MNKLTFKEIETILESKLFKEHYHEPSRWFRDDVYQNADEIEEEGEFKETFQKLGTFKCVEKFGGEGKGDDYYRIFHFIDHDIYIKFQGWYASHAGSEYEYMLEVRPEQITITEYKQV